MNTIFSPPSKSPTYWICGNLWITSLLALPLSASKITYEDDIFPVLEANCLNCHNPDKKKGGLDLSTYQDLLAGGSGGKIVIPGDGSSSRLFTVSVQTEEPIMPPEGDQLDTTQTNLFRAWIDGGLLETSSSEKKKAPKPTFNLEAVTDPRKRPEGPPPMPLTGEKGFSREPVVVTSRTTTVNDMEASPWAPLLAVTAQRQILLYHTDTLELLAILPFPNGMPESLAFHPNGKYLVVGGGIAGKSGTTVTWDLPQGKILMEQGREYDSVLAADISPDLGQISLGGPSRILKIWDTRERELLHRVKKHTDWITALRYSPDGSLIASGDRNNGIHLWDSDSAAEHYTLTGHQGSIVDLKWRSDSKVIVSASADAHLALWDVKNGKQIKKIQAHPGGVLAMDYSEKGLIVTSGRDHKVKFWKHDLGFRQELPVFTKEITEVEFSHDGKRAFTANWDGLIRVWSTESFKEVGEISSNPPKIADRIAAFEKDLAALEQTIREKKNSLEEQEQLLANSSEPDPRTEALIGTLKGEYGTLNTEKQALLKKIANWRQ